MNPSVLAAIALLAVGLALLVLGRRLRRRARLPAGRILGTDAGAQPGPLLVSRRHGLNGRPDYLLRRGGEVIPVELKPSHDRLHPSAVMQLMAYCLLVEEQFGRPSHGLLVLRDGVERVPYTDARRAALLATLSAMRAAPAVPPRSHHQPARCRACAFAPLCAQSLATDR